MLVCRDECSRLAEMLEEKTKALELLISEHQEVKGQLEATTLRADNAEAENKMLIDRWMLEKMKDAERLNEVYLVSAIIKCYMLTYILIKLEYWQVGSGKCHISLI